MKWLCQSHKKSHILFALQWNQLNHVCFSRTNLTGFHNSYRRFSYILVSCRQLLSTAEAKLKVLTTMTIMTTTGEGDKDWGVYKGIFFHYFRGVTPAYTLGSASLSRRRPAITRMESQRRRLMFSSTSRSCDRRWLDAGSDGRFAGERVEPGDDGTISEWCTLQSKYDGIFVLDNRSKCDY